MDELKKAKLDLPPPPQENEFPKRPFGVFQEPNFEAKVICCCFHFDVQMYFVFSNNTKYFYSNGAQVGIRKSIFSNTEKEVTETVILKREQTAQELSEHQSDAATGTIGSNGHLNTGKKIVRQILCSTKITWTMYLACCMRAPSNHKSFFTNSISFAHESITAFQHPCTHEFQDTMKQTHNRYGTARWLTFSLSLLSF